MTDWLPTLLDPRYKISATGQVRGPSGRILRQSVSDSGYLRVKTPRVLLIHRAVLEAFVGPAPSPRHEAAHKDGRKRNNRLENLEWKLKEHNEADKKLHGTAPRKFTGHHRTGHVAKVIVLSEIGCSFSRIGRALGLHRSSVSRIVRGLRRKEWRVA